MRLDRTLAKAFIIFSLCLAAALHAAPPKRLQILVPVYREYQNGNLQRFVKSLLDLKTHPTIKTDIDLIISVNHPQDASVEIRKENKTTLDYLRNLQPELPAHVHLHVIDQTNPGLKETRMGEIRQNLFVASYQDGPADFEDTIVHHMDADSTLPENYLLELQTAYSDPSVQWSMFGMDFALASESPIENTKRVLEHQLGLAIYEGANVFLDRTSTSHPPRIVSRKRALQNIGGIPSVISAEGDALIKSFKKTFGPPLSLASTRISTAARARVDSFIGKSLLDKQLHQSEEHLNVVKAKSLTRATLIKIKILYPSYFEIYEQKIQAVLNAQKQINHFRHETLKKIATAIAQHGVSHASVKKLLRQGDVFFQNDWLVGELQKMLQEHDNNVSAVVQIFCDNFSHFVNPLLSDQSESLYKVRVASDALFEAKKNSSETPINSDQRLRLSEEITHWWIETIEKRLQLEALWYKLFQTIYIPGENAGNIISNLFDHNVMQQHSLRDSDHPLAALGQIHEELMQTLSDLGTISTMVDKSKLLELWHPVQLSQASFVNFQELADSLRHFRNKLKIPALKTTHLQKWNLILGQQVAQLRNRHFKKITLPEWLVNLDYGIFSFGQIVSKQQRLSRTEFLKRLDNALTQAEDLTNQKPDWFINRRYLKPSCKSIILKSRR